jgi:glycosyltransferase involved in cell wall biosynthesis
MSYPEESCIIRITVPHGAQSFLGDRIPFQGWCAAPDGADIPSVIKQNPSEAFCFYTRQVGFEGDERDSQCFSWVRISSVDCPDTALSIEGLSYSYNDTGFTFVTGETFEEVVHFNGYVRVSQSVARSAIYELLMVCSLEHTILHSNFARFHLEDQNTFEGSIHGGVEYEFPPVLYYPEILLSSWAVHKGSRITSSDLEICGTEGPYKDCSTSTWIGLSGSMCASTYPDFEEARDSGIIHHVEFRTNESTALYQDLAVRQFVSSEKGEKEEIPQGVTRLYCRYSDGFITSVKADEGLLCIDGLLLSDHLPDECFYLRTQYWEEPSPCSFEAQYHPASCSPVSLGACTDREKPGFSLVIPCKEIPLYCNDFMLFLKSEERLIPLTTHEDVKVILALIRKEHRHAYDAAYPSPIRRFLRSQKRNFIYQISHKRSKNSAQLQSSDRHSPAPDSVSFFFHNLEAVEGAPLVAVNLLSSFSEISSFSSEETFVTSFGTGALKDEVQKYSVSYEYCPDGAMIHQTEERYCKTLAHIRNQLRERGARLVIVNCLDSFIAVDAAVREGVPVLWIIHESVDPRIFYRKHPYRLRMHCLHALKHASKVIFVSKATHDLFVPSLGSTSTAIVPNAIDIDAFEMKLSSVNQDEVRKDLGLAPDTLVLLSVGTTTERKGQDRTLRELALLVQARSGLDFVFLVVGARDIPFLEKLKTMADELGLTEQVRFIYETPEVLPYYAIADFFIINSREESFPLVTLEAFAARVPVLSTEVFGLKEIVRHEVNALAFDADNEGALCNSIIRLLDEGSLSRSLSENAFQTVREMYSMSGWKKRYSEIIAEVLS